MSATEHSASDGREPLLALRGIVKRFGAVQALGGVDFDVRPGEVVGLVGDNGAGKSTLVKVMSGIYLPDAGEYRFDGAVRHVRGPGDATALGVATVYQDLALCDNLDVVANLFVGRETASGGLGGWLRALDEPTAALGVQQTAQVLALIKRLREQGLAVVVISHNLADVFEVVDRIFVLRLGRRAGVFEVGATSHEEVVAAITGAEFGRGGDGAGQPSSAEAAR